MSSTSNGVRTMLALIPTILGVFFVGLGAVILIPAPGVCTYLEPPPPGTVCPSPPVDYQLAGILFGVGILLTTLGAVLLVRQFLHRRRSQPEQALNPISQ
jgi:hypothetical protein